MTLQARGVGYRYPSGHVGVHAVDLAVSPGEIVLLTGPTGCGKSTLLRLLCGLLVRHGAGESLGAVTIGGRDVWSLSPAERAQAIGFVGQEPGDQLVAGTVGDEVAFALGSIALPPEEMPARVRQMLELVGLDVELARAPGALSGGQQQRLVVASALAAGAEVLLLDEPLAHLDPEGAGELMSELRALAATGTSVLLVEHRIPQVLEYVDRVLVMDAGELVARADRAAIEGGDVEILEVLRRLGLTLPGWLDLVDRIGGDPGERSWPRQPVADLPREHLLEAGPLSWSFARGAPPVLASVQIALRRGERVALIGSNGAGKSTLLGALAGVYRAGRVRCSGRVVAVPQDPDLALFMGSVEDELAYGPREQRLTAGAVAARVESAARALSVHELLPHPPQALSRGQRLRVAVAAALATEPAVLLLDEPTSGQDLAHVERMLKVLDACVGALLFATHDIDLALRHATRVVIMTEGQVAWSGPPLDLPADIPRSRLSTFCLERGLVPDTPEVLARVLEVGWTRARG